MVIIPSFSLILPVKNRGCVYASGLLNGQKFDAGYLSTIPKHVILQTNRLSKFIIFLNFKVFIKSTVNSTGMPNVCKVHKHYQKIMFNSELNIFFTSWQITAVQSNCIIFFQECFEILAFCQCTCVHSYKNH